MKNYLIPLNLIVILSFGCNNNTIIKPMKYEKDDINYSCDAHIVDGKTIEIRCFDFNRNVILIDSFDNDFKWRGTSKSFYSNGQIKQIGAYKNDKKVGIWKTYYETGSLKTYDYYNPDSLRITYQKNYDTLGNLYSLIYPINFYSSDSTKAIVNQQFDVMVELEYSEFKNLSTMCIFDNDGDTNIYEDTLQYDGSKVRYQVSSSQTGWNTLNGILIEVNSDGQNNDEKYGGERKFEFKYYVWE